jgi:hypothetical protein
MTTEQEGAGPAWPAPINGDCGPSPLGLTLSPGSAPQKIADSQKREVVKSLREFHPDDSWQRAKVDDPVE